MKVLMAPAGDQRDQAPPEGELVFVPVEHCDGDACSCRRTFIGLISGRATTEAVVVERSEMTADVLSVAVADALSRRGWLDEGWSQRNDELLDATWGASVESVAELRAGVMVGRHGRLLVPLPSEETPRGDRPVERTLVA